MVWNVPVVSWGQLCWLCPLPVSCAPPVYLLEGQCEKQAFTIYTVFSTNPKHRPILATMKKINYPIQNQHIHIIIE